MSRVCEICQKGQVSGNKVSHSNIKTKRTWGANVHKVDMAQNDGTVKPVYVCTRCLRTMKKEAK